MANCVQNFIRMDFLLQAALERFWPAVARFPAHNIIARLPALGITHIFPRLTLILVLIGSLCPLICSGYFRFRFTTQIKKKTRKSKANCAFIIYNSEFAADHQRLSYWPRECFTITPWYNLDSLISVTYLLSKSAPTLEMVKRKYETTPTTWSWLIT